MIVLRDPQTAGEVTDPYIRELVALRFAQVMAGELEAGMDTQKRGIYPSVVGLLEGVLFDAVTQRIAADTR